MINLHKKIINKQILLLIFPVFLFTYPQDTKYSVIQCASKQLSLITNYQNDTSNTIANWDLKWTDTGQGAQLVKKMTKNQRVNYFIGISSIARKNLLMLNLYTMRKYFPDQYDFFPQTFLFPSDNKKIIKYQKQKIKHHEKVTFIVKPQASCQGKGIYLCQHFSQIDAQSKSIVQQYISKPMLHQGLKFDFRVYVLLKNVSPLQIYLYKQGLVRFATQKYQPPTKFNLDDLCLHLTNYAINKHSPKYQFNQTMSDLNFGHKKSLAQFFKILTSMGINSYRIWRQIKQCVIKTIISVQPHLHTQYRKAQPKNQSQSLCYQVLGFDFMVNDQKKVYLLQVNQSPSFSTQTPLDFLVKNFLIKDTLKIVMFDKQRKRVNLQLRSKKMKTQTDTQSPQRNKKQRKQYFEQIPSQILGNYEKIFPCADEGTQNIYEKMIMCIKADYHKTNMDQIQTFIQGHSIQKVESKSPQLKIKHRRDKSFDLIKSVERQNFIKQKLRHQTLSNQNSNPIIRLNQNRRRILSLKKQMISSKSSSRNGYINAYSKNQTQSMLPIKMTGQLILQKAKSKLIYQTLPASTKLQTSIQKQKAKRLSPIDVQSLSNLNVLSQHLITIKKPPKRPNSGKKFKMSKNQSQQEILTSFKKNRQNQILNKSKDLSSKIEYYENRMIFQRKRQDIRSHLKKYIQFLNPIQKAAQQRIQKEDQGCLSQCENNNSTE